MLIKGVHGVCEDFNSFIGISLKTQFKQLFWAEYPAVHYMNKSWPDLIIQLVYASFNQGELTQRTHVYVVETTSISWLYRIGTIDDIEIRNSKEI